MTRDDSEYTGDRPPRRDSGRYGPPEGRRRAPADRPGDHWPGDPAGPGAGDDTEFYPPAADSQPGQGYVPDPRYGPDPGAGYGADGSYGSGAGGTVAATVPALGGYGGADGGYGSGARYSGRRQRLRPGSGLRPQCGL